MSWSDLRARFRRFRRRRTENRRYAEVRRQLSDFTDLDRQIATFKLRPLISVIVPVFNIEEKWLRNCITSVTSQIYPNWELCIADDASTLPHIRPLIEEFVQRDPRIKAIFRPENGHISAASNSALEIACGEFSVFLDHDDELVPDALFWVINEINSYPDAALIYSDEDVIDATGRHSDPKFKPGFSPDLHYSQNTTTHLSAYRTDLIKEVGQLRIEFEGSQDYDLSLRVIDSVPESSIRHIPRVLYHWRSIPSSIAGGKGAKPYAYEAARKALKSKFDRSAIDADVVLAKDNLNRVRYRMRVSPTVAVITGGEANPDLFSKTDYPRFEIISTAADGGVAQQLNDAAASTKNDIICFLQGYLVPTSSAWLSEMVHFLSQERIGAVGGKLLRIDGCIDQTGVIIGGERLIRKAHHGYPRDHVGNFYRAALIGNYSAVSWNCLAVRREVFDRFGGFDAEHLPSQLFDTDFCLRLGEAGLRIVYTPYAELQFAHRISDGNPSKIESEYFRRRWAALIEFDPLSNPNFSLTGEAFSIKS